MQTEDPDGISFPYVKVGINQMVGSNAWFQQIFQKQAFNRRHYLTWNFASDFRAARKFSVFCHPAVSAWSQKFSMAPLKSSSKIVDGPVA